MGDDEADGKGDGGGILGEALGKGSHVWLTDVCGCQRGREATLKGIQELASADVVHRSWGVVQRDKSLFCLPDTPLPALMWSIGEGGSLPLNHRISFQDIVILVGMPEDEEDKKATCSKSQLLVESENSDSDIPLVEMKREPPKKTGWKPAVGRDVTINRVDAERQRREKLNNLFYALRSMVLNDSRNDKASMLSDAVCYINQLKARIGELESQIKVVQGISGRSSRRSLTPPTT
ncbi:hypothetical protein MLD38_018221 [Melastoma candidum]|uniref:Uncharacterized protein n=1 Tax=Melastoma candidum TaxID=119954 RepID=A0ACB9QU86_9MYRT|nr:hypothetical protein MLD38_018221 [Melastoma candidum]